MSPFVPLATEVADLGVEARSVEVLISYEVVRLFSEQLYASPVKAIEELVVNAWDADAERCSVLVDLDADRPVIAVFDDGNGMTLGELENLWHIGVSRKPEASGPRKMIGKFGIGKLASYAVARRATYISKSTDGVHIVTINFDDFVAATSPQGIPSPVTLAIRKIDALSELMSTSAFRDVQAALQLGSKSIDLESLPSWTLVVLEDLKEKAAALKTGRLRWVLETAMPLAADFSCYLNSELVVSAKAKLEQAVFFKVADLEEARLNALSAVTGSRWERRGDLLTSPNFPSGVSGEVFVTNKSLYADGGKSEDLGRSHGFFVRVNNRLINETDPLFGARPLSFTTWYRFAAIVDVDDLNQFVTASRDDVEQTQLKIEIRQLLIQLFNQARDAYEALERQREAENKRKREGVRDYVSTELVERPLADALVHRQGQGQPDEWEYLEAVADPDELARFVESLYTDVRADLRYTYRYSPRGASEKLLRFDAVQRVFELNEDHELVLEFADGTESKKLLEILATTEAVLEVYLSQAGLPRELVRDVLQKRDFLLRSLARDQSYSLPALAQALRAAASDANDLEVALVGALRALGFSTHHIGGSGTPDGLAGYTIHGVESRSFTLEAKSSQDVPSLSQLDFAGLRSHYAAVGAEGCLLVAPSYPGGDDPTSEVSTRAKQQGVSCWTIDQLSRVVLSAETRRLNAQKIQEIVLSAFMPADVSSAVEAIFASPQFASDELHRAVIKSLADLEGRLSNTPRNLMLLAAEISRDAAFAGIKLSDVADAVEDLARASRGMLWRAENDDVFVLGDLNELARRVRHLTGDVSVPRRGGTFRR